MLLLIFAYCIIGAAVVIGYSARLLNNPWENSYFESPQTYAAINAVKTGNLYIPITEPPYTPQAYAPLYYAINAGLARLAHLDLDRSILYMRFATFLAYLLCGLMVYLVCQAAAIPRFYSVLASLMMLGQPDFLGWNISPRPDMLYMLAMLGSLFCVMKWADRLWLGYGLAGLLAGVSFLIKQPGLAVAAGIFLVLVLEKRFKQAVVLTVSTIAPVVLVFCILYFRRDPFFQQIKFVGNSLWSVSDAVNFVGDHMIIAHWLVPIGLTLLGFFRAVTLDRNAKMIASFTAMNWMMGLATLPQIGGYLNYLLPGLIGTALLLPYAVQMIQEHMRSLMTVALAAVILLAATATSVASVKGAGNYFRAPSQDSLDWLRPYRVLSDLTTMNVHGRDPILLDPFGAHVLELTGHWDPTPLVDGLNTGLYDMIILTRVNVFHFIPSFRGISYFSPKEISIINQKYEILCTTLDRMVLRPRGRDIPVTPEMIGRMFNESCGTGFRSHPMSLKLAPDAR